ncbi:MAG: hypothetical protein K2X91_11220, partial [Thermoleophilia bacterium]|nr:hypothetical protein [Thermoleophilia bacterium]
PGDLDLDAESLHGLGSEFDLVGVPARIFSAAAVAVAVAVALSVSRDGRFGKLDPAAAEVLLAPR